MIPRWLAISYVEKHRYNSSAKPVDYRHSVLFCIHIAMQVVSCNIRRTGWTVSKHHALNVNERQLILCEVFRTVHFSCLHPDHLVDYTRMVGISYIELHMYNSSAQPMVYGHSENALWATKSHSHASSFRHGMRRIWMNCRNRAFNVNEWQLTLCAEQYIICFFSQIT